MARGEKITEAKFRTIKILFKGGASVDEVVEAMKIGRCAAYGCRNCETFEEYRTWARERNAPYRKKKTEKPAKEEEPQQEQQQDPQVVEHRQTIVVQASHYMLEEQRKTNELLTAISNKLAFIVDELTK